MARNRQEPEPRAETSTASTHTSERQAILPSNVPASRSTTFGETVFNMINCFVGAGILTVPYAFSLGGSAAIWALALVSGLNWQASLILGRAIDAAADLQSAASRGSGVPPRSHWDLAALGKVAFGAGGERAIRIIMILELWFALETFLVLIGINVHLVTGIRPDIAIVGAGLLGMLSLAVSLRTFSSISLLSIFCMAGGLLSIVVYGEETPKVATGTHRVLDQHAIATSVSIFFYCLSGLPCIPNIRNNMLKKSEYPVACHWSFAFAFVYYAAVGLLACRYFGDRVHQSFTQNLVPEHALGRPSPMGSLLVLSAGLFAAKLQAGFPLYAAPVLDALGFGSEQRPQESVWLARFAFTAISVLFAIFAQDSLVAVAGLTGALLTTSTSIIFPCVAYVALTRRSAKHLGGADAAGLGAVIVIGSALGVLGTLEAFQRMSGAHFPVPPLLPAAPHASPPAVMRKAN